MELCSLRMNKGGVQFKDPPLSPDGLEFKYSWFSEANVIANIKFCDFVITQRVYKPRLAFTERITS